jgi:carnitine 3-dehydrogenase
MTISFPSPHEVRTVACIGAGVIGGGWVAHFLARGYDVVMWDPAPDSADKVRRLVDNAWPTLTELGLAEGARPDRLQIAPTLEEAVAQADFVQESAPEILDVKIDLLNRIDAAAPPSIVISSSTSGYSMTEMQITAPHPNRLVVGHPFNPPYLVPLVEVVGGEKTSPEAVAWASQFFALTGKSVITMDKEVPGFIANRLQEALWREALHMISAGEATVEQIDQAVTDGPGLRWPFHGPMTTFHLAGGEGGMAHALEHFGPSLESPWSRLMSPPLTENLQATLIDGVEKLTDARPTSDLIRERDRCMVAVIRAIEGIRGASS